MQPDATKSCRICGAVKPLGEFYERRSACKDCERAAARVRSQKNYYANREGVLARQAEYRARNPDKVREKAKAYEREHREEARARARQWARENPARMLARVAEWKRTHPARAAEIQRTYRLANLLRYAGHRQTRRTRQRNAHIEHVDHLTVFERDGWICGICGLPVDPSEASVDHIVPLARGGEHSYQNVQTAHRRCNFSKGARLLTPEESRCE